MKLEWDGVVAELAVGQPGPFDRGLAFLDVLLRFASWIVEGHHPFGWPGQVDDDEADTGMQIPGMPFYLGNCAPHLGQTPARLLGFGSLAKRARNPRFLMANP